VELSARPTVASRSVISLCQATLLRPRSLQIVGSRLDPSAHILRLTLLSNGVW
jgi:hypothetical protein